MDQLLQLKVCPACRKQKTGFEFYAKGNRLSGYCKECTKLRTKKRYELIKDTQEYKEYRRELESSAAFKIRVRVTQLKYLANNRSKRKARRLVEAAVRSGKMLRSPCRLCDNPKVEAHHTDYAKPFEVTWLCKTCHEREHHKQSTL